MRWTAKNNNRIINDTSCMDVMIIQILCNEYMKVIHYSAHLNTVCC